jgi:uncharacterized protein
MTPYKKSSEYVATPPCRSELALEAASPKPHWRSRASSLLCPLVISVALLVGCAHSVEPRYYTLGFPTAPANQEAGSKVSRNISIGPINIPEVVDRPQLVLQAGPNRVAMLEQHRWAQPLKSEISRVIAASLMQQVAGAWVTDYRNGSGQNIDYRVSINVQRFESQPGEGVTIEALWVVRPAGNGEARMGKSVVREVLAGNDYEALVAAHGRALVAISRDIGAAIQSAGAEATASNR